MQNIENIIKLALTDGVEKLNESSGYMKVVLSSN